MGVDREDFSDAANWQTPQELPDLRRVGIVALDTETQRRGAARRPRLGLAMARRIYLRHQRRLARGRRHSRASTFPLRHPDTDNFDPAQVYRWLKDLIASGVRIVTLNGVLRLRLAAHRRRHPDAAVRSPRRDRRARDHDRREPVQLQPRRAVRNATACPARTRRCCAGGRGRGLRVRRRRSTPRVHLATAGALCRPLRRGRCGQHARAVREAQSDPGSGRDPRRLSARSRPAADGAGDAPARHPHRSGRRRAGARSAAAETRCRAGRAFGTARRAVSMDEINGRKWKEQTFDKYGISYPRTAKGNPSFAAGKSGWMAKHRALAAAADRDREQIRRRRHTSFSKGTSSTTSSTGAFTPRSIRSARTTAARARCASPIPIRRCSRCRRATRNWGR